MGFGLGFGFVDAGDSWVCNLCVWVGCCVVCLGFGVATRFAVFWLLRCSWWFTCLGFDLTLGWICWC